MVHASAVRICVSSVAKEVFPLFLSRRCHARRDTKHSQFKKQHAFSEASGIQRDTDGLHQKKLVKNILSGGAAAPANFVQPSSKQTTAPGAVAAKSDQRLPIDSEARKKNRTLATDKVLALLHTVNPDLFNLAEVVGKWVWVTFTEQPAPTHRQQLSQLGFHWNRERQAWQHPCGAFRLHGVGDPHEKYASYYPADHQAA